MTIDLSPDEIKYAKRRIKFYDDRSRKWVYLRLILLFVAILNLSTSGRWLWMLEKQNTKEYNLTKNTAFESVSNDFIKQYIDKKFECNSIQSRAVFLGFTSGLLGIFLLLYTVAQWNSHKNEPLEIKVYKILIE